MHTSQVFIVFLSIAATCFSDHVISKRCTCPPPQCTCVPTIGVSYMTCHCAQIGICPCSAFEQMQQCQPTCQEVCQRNCFVNCGICNTECFTTCSSLPRIQNAQTPWIQENTGAQPIPSISKQQTSLFPIIPQAHSNLNQCTCPTPDCFCVPIVGSSYLTCNCEYPVPCSCSRNEQLQQCQPTCQEVCQRSCSRNCTACTNICYTTCSSLSSVQVTPIPQIQQFTPVTLLPQTISTELPQLNPVVPMARHVESNPKQCTCLAPNCICVPTIESLHLTCSCEYPEPCFCTAEEQMQQCQPTCQEVCLRTCTVHCAVCNYACFTTCSSLPNDETSQLSQIQHPPMINHPLHTFPPAFPKILPTVPLHTVPTISLETSSYMPTLSSQVTLMQTSQPNPTVISQTESPSSVSSQIMQRSTVGQCICSPPVCICVPTVTSTFITCNCEYPNPCPCSPEGQLQQCQPTCQEVCQSSCTTNCAICNYACFTTCSSLPKEQTTLVSQIHSSTVTPLPNQTVPTIPQIHSMPDQCSCPTPQCGCFPTVGSMYLTCNCEYSNPCSCSLEMQMQQCQPTCQEVCQRSCTVQCAVCSHTCFTTCSSLPNRKETKARRSQQYSTAPYILQQRVPSIARRMFVGSWNQ